MQSKKLGKWGEQVAVDYLVAHGYAITERNWRIDHFEVDIVAMQHGRLIFVEVKTRADKASDPLDAVDRKKIMNLVRSANAYVLTHGLPHEIQFDIITISGSPDDFSLQHFPDAFEPPLKTY